MKARKTFALGHLQGDVFAIANMQRWMKEHQMSSEAGIVDTTTDEGGVKIWDENFGIAEPLAYQQLIMLKNWAPFAKRLRCRGKANISVQLQDLERKADKVRAKQGSDVHAAVASNINNTISIG